MPKMGSLMSAIAEEPQWYRVQILNVKGGHVLIITLLKPGKLGVGYEPKVADWLHGRTRSTLRDCKSSMGSPDPGPEHMAISWSPLKRPDCTMKTAN